MTPPKIILGSEFRLTRAAERHILEFIGQVQSRSGFEGCKTEISWASVGLPGEEFIPGPRIIGVDDRLLEANPDFYLVGEQKVPIALDKMRIQECRDKVLDYRCERLVLVYLDDVL
ncbi:hypothetical protein [Mesorhizobium abyssinicae]|uniref:hypothetical protein n=1 Tax=Mesorhizobium abyssinicae TaxID=1209958 RepID=UPI0033965AE2